MMCVVVTHQPLLSVTFSSGFYLVLREASSRIPWVPSGLHCVSARVLEVSSLLLDCPHLPTMSCNIVALDPCDVVEIDLRDLRLMNRRTKE